MVRTLGILGGGQLGRMTALAAARLGLPTHIFCQHGHEPAAQVTPHVTLGSFDDEKKLAEFAAAVDVITLEWENVPLQALALLATHKPVYPAPSVLAITQDRVAEKTFAQTHGMGTAPFAACHTLDDVHKAL
ncbi:MAG: 5-(carboxyamino)imidazole ribonucleotide synthase, partial [Alphaproteobacteria bacterium]|nr:5-(carboxyamino)imidazole ribonucleotide synthase [Alphaproteobacteria bacterium]